MVATQLYTVVDTMIIGLCLDAGALAAVSNASTVLLVFLFVSGGMELGGGLLLMPVAGLVQALVFFVAQNTAARQPDRVQEGARQARSILLAYALLVTAGMAPCCSAARRWSLPLPPCAICRRPACGAASGWVCIWHPTLAPPSST